MGMDLDVSVGYGILVSGGLDYEKEYKLREQLLSATDEDLIDDGYGVYDILEAVLKPYKTLSYAIGRFADDLSGVAIFIDRLSDNESWKSFTLNASFILTDEEFSELLDIAHKLGMTTDDFKIVVLPSYW